MSGAFWGAADDAESIRVIHRALDLGVTLVDTAEAYGGGHAEEVVGKALAGRRRQAVIATKAAPNHLEAAEAVKALEGSLKRLQTDYVDVYFIHWPNPDLPLGATMEAFERLRAEGRIRALGVSNFGPKEMDTARQHGVIDVLQPPYNMLWREVEAGTLPYCREHNIGVMPYSGLAQGLLTGALSRNTTFAEGDERRTTVLFQPGTYRARPRCGRRLAPDRREIRQVRRPTCDPVADQPARRQFAPARRKDSARDRGKRWQRRLDNRCGRRRRDRPADPPRVEGNRRQGRHVRLLGEAARGEGESVSARDGDPSRYPTSSSSVMSRSVFSIRCSRIAAAARFGSRAAKAS